MNDLARVNEYLLKLTGEKRVHCSVSPTKGRILTAARSFTTGDVLFEEKTLREVVTPRGNDLYDLLCHRSHDEDWDLDPIWYWCALNSVISDDDELALKKIAKGVDDGSPVLRVLDEFLCLPIPRITSDVREKLNMFFAPVTELSEEVESLHTMMVEACGLDRVLAIRLSAAEEAVTTYMMSMIEIHRLEAYLKTWILNCFECQDEPLAFGTYFAPTFCSHSCLPNTVWHLTNKGIYSLVARCNISEGQELSLSYLGDADLMNTTLERQEELQLTKGFICTCPRCENEADLSRGFRCKVCNAGQWFMATDRKSPRSISPKSLNGLKRVNVDERKWLVCDEAISQSLPSHLNWSLPELDDPKLSENSMCHWLDRFTPEECLNCAHKIPEDEIFEMLTIEGWLHKCYEARNELSCHDIGEAAHVAMQHLGQHQLLVKLLSERAAFWSSSDPLLSLQLNQRRVQIYKTMSPMLCGTVAWAENDVFRSCLLLHGFPTNPESDGKVSLSVCEDLIMDDEAWRSCFSSLRIISVVFREDNEYFTEPAEFAAAILHPLSAAVLTTAEKHEKRILRDQYLSILLKAEALHVVSAEEVKQLTALHR